MESFGGSPRGRILYLPALDSSMQITRSNLYFPLDAIRARELGSLKRDTITIANELPFEGKAKRAA
jgi:hypothetical protein